MHRFVGYLLHGTPLLALALAPACSSRTPTVSALEPPHAVGGSLITVQGSDTDVATVIWDAGLPTERVIPTNLGATFFTVPRDATAGIHPVVFKNTAGASTPMNFVVDPGPPVLAGTPRIDHIMVRCGHHGPTLDVAACALLFDKPRDGVWASDHFGVVGNMAGVGVSIGKATDQTKEQFHICATSKCRSRSAA